MAGTEKILTRQVPPLVWQGYYHRRWRHRVHIFPAVSIAIAIKNIAPGTEILFVGRRERWNGKGTAGGLPN